MIDADPVSPRYLAFERRMTVIRVAVVAIPVLLVVLLMVEMVR